jgi:hypothetical protein
MSCADSMRTFPVESSERNLDGGGAALRLARPPDLPLLALPGLAAVPGLAVLDWPALDLPALPDLAGLPGFAPLEVRRCDVELARPDFFGLPAGRDLLCGPGRADVTP